MQSKWGIERGKFISFLIVLTQNRGCNNMKITQIMKHMSVFLDMVAIATYQSGILAQCITWYTDNLLKLLTKWWDITRDFPFFNIWWFINNNNYTSVIKTAFHSLACNKINNIYKNKINQNKPNFIPCIWRHNLQIINISKNKWSLQWTLQASVWFRHFGCSCIERHGRMKVHDPF